MAAEQGPNVLCCMPNRTKCILLVPVMRGAPATELGVLRRQKKLQ
jgi:hypothetical protein